MEIRRPSPESERLSPERFRDLKDVVATLINEVSEPLIGDEGSTGSHAVTGERRELTEGKGSVIIASYKEDERTFMAQQITEATGMQIDNPVGHIEARLVTEEAKFDCGLYMTEDERIVGFANCSLSDPDEVLLDESRACYDFAAAIGLQDLWVNHMFSGDLMSKMEFTLTDRQASDMTGFLSKQLPGTSG